MVYHYHLSSQISRLSGRLRLCPNFLKLSNILNVVEQPGASILVFTNLQMGLSFSQSDSLSSVKPGGASANCITVISHSDQGEMKLLKTNQCLNYMRLVLRQTSDKELLKHLKLNLL